VFELAAVGGCSSGAQAGRATPSTLDSSKLTPRGGCVGGSGREHVSPNNAFLRASCRPTPNLLGVRERTRRCRSALLDKAGGQQFCTHNLSGLSMHRLDIGERPTPTPARPSVPMHPTDSSRL
jgi:hypothetical protein